MKLIYPEGDRRNKRWSYKGQANKMLKFIKDGDVIYDIGSNVFDHTIYFAIKRPTAHIFSFEPLAEYYDMGIQNMKDHNIKNVTPLKIATSDKKEILKMNINKQASSLTSFDDSKDFETIHTDTIDNLVKDGTLTPPNVIKIDVEGFALNTFLGAIGTIKEYSPIIMFESHPGFVELEQFIEKYQTLFDLGYKIVMNFNKREHTFIKGENGKVLSKDELKEIWVNTNGEWRVWGLRDKFDSSESREELRILKKEYKQIPSKFKNPAIDCFDRNYLGYLH